MATVSNTLAAVLLTTINVGGATGAITLQYSGGGQALVFIGTTNVYTATAGDILVWSLVNFPGSPQLKIYKLVPSIINL